jgi:hypothetical protein
MNVLEWLKMKAVVPYNSGHAHDLVPSPKTTACVMVVRKSS